MPIRVPPQPKRTLTRPIALTRPSAEIGDLADADNCLARPIYFLNDLPFRLKRSGTLIDRLTIPRLVLQ